MSGVEKGTPEGPNTYIFVVGIEKYDEPTWDVEGPCANALAMANLVTSTWIRQPGDKTYLFLCSSRDLDKEMAEVKAKGVDVRRTGDATSIETFWRTELTRDVPANSRLLFFWSGHGFTSKRRNRIFFCSDYQAKLPSRVFNATNFLSSLLTNDYACFSDQIILADVCGVYTDTRVAETTEELDLSGRNQLAYFATREGRYAKGKEGHGVFTGAVLKVLEELKGWPEQQKFVPALEEALSQIDASPFRISGFHNQGEVRPTIVGGDAHFKSAREGRRHAMSAHWGPASRGVETDDAAGWYFTGRSNAVQRLVEWLAAPEDAPDQRMLVVTGSPGCGKSAVISRVVTLADPDYSQRVPLDDVPAHLIPEEGVIDAAVYAKGATVESIVLQIAMQVCPGAANFQQLTGQLGARAGRAVIVIDGLEEAATGQAGEIAREVLRPLSQLRNVKVLVGTQRDRVVRRGRRAAPRGLLASLGPEKEEIDLDEPPYLDKGDIALYVARRLLAENDVRISTPYRDRPKDFVRQVAESVAEEAGTSFLIARILVQVLLASDTALEAVPRGEGTSRFPLSVGEAFGKYLLGYGDDEAKIRHLLEPLAWAEGLGLPKHRFWARIASALSGETYSEDDVDWLLGVAGAFVAEDLEGERSVFRLFHEALAEHLREQRDSPDCHSRITDALIAATRANLDGHLDWVSADPYVRSHLAHHAAQAGRLDEFLAQPAFLLAADATRLLIAIHSVQTVSPLTPGQVYLHASHHIREARSLGEAASYLEMEARKLGADLAHEVEGLRVQRPWSVPWAAWAPVGASRVLGTHGDSITALALGEDEGRPVAVTAGLDGFVRAWDVASGGSLRELHDVTSPVDGIGITHISGRSVIVSGDFKGVLRRVYLDSGEPMGDPIETSHQWIRSMSLTELAGRTVAVTSGHDRMTRIWDIASGAKLKEFQQAADSMAVTRLHGKPVGVFADEYAKTACLRDLETGEEIAEAFKNPDHTIGAVATAEFGARAVALTGWGDGTVWVWDLESGKRSEAPFGKHSRVITSLAVAQIADRRIAATGSLREARVWDLESNTEIGTPLVGHGDRIVSLDFTEIDEGPIVVTGSMDGTVRVWNLAAELGRSTTAAASSRGLTGENLGSDEEGRLTAASTYHTGGVGVGDFRGQSIVVSGANDGFLTVRNMMSGQQLGEPCSVFHPYYETHTREVRVDRLGSRWVIAYANFWDAGAWDLESGEGWRYAEGRQRRFICGLGAVDGRCVVVSTGEPDHGGRKISDPDVRVTDIISKRRVGKPLRISLWRTYHHRPKCAAVGWLGGLTVVATGGSDGELRIWDLASGRRIPRHRPRLRFHTGPINCIAIGPIGAETACVLGGEDGRVSMWSLDSKKLLCDPIQAHLSAYSSTVGRRGVTAVAVMRVKGNSVVVSGGHDHRLRVWEPGTSVALADIDAGASIVSLAVRDDWVIVGCQHGVLALRLRLDSSIWDSGNRAGVVP